MEKKDKRNKILKVAGLIGLFLLVFGLSYALFTVTLNGTKKVKIKTGKLELQLLDSNNNPIYITNQNNTTSYEINLDNQVPESDEAGLRTTAFEFKLKNTGNLKASYTIYLDDVALESGETRIDDQYIRYSLTRNGSEENPQGLSSRELDKGSIEADNTTYTYTLKIWIAEDATNEAMDKVFNATLRVEGTQYIQEVPFDEGTFAEALYTKGIVGHYNVTNDKLPNGFDAENEAEGLIEYIDETGTVTYAYRGVNVNNYVTFAEQTWRIVRIQSDGKIKLVKDAALNYQNANYTTTKVYNNGSTRTNVYYNQSYSSDEYSKYSGSYIEGYLNAWFDAVFSDNYNDQIVENIYCSDRYEPENPSPLKSSDFSSYAHLYGVWNRGEGDGNGSYIWSPSVSCTSDDEVSAKVAMITADEYVLAGAAGLYVSGETYDSYLKRPYTYWTMSPAAFNYNMPNSYRADRGGYLGLDFVNTNYSVVPVITLNANVLPSSGDGTSEHPYVIS